MRRLGVLIPLVLFVALVTLFYFRLYAGDPQKLPSALIGREAPEFTLPPLDGLTFADGAAVPGLARKDLGNGQVTVINVFASWCAPCRDEHPLLERLARMNRVKLVGLAYKDEPQNTLKFLSEMGNPFSAVGRDDKGRAAIDWGVYGVPETFVIGKDGRIAYKHIGPLTEASLTDVLLPEIDKAERGSTSALLR
ncbi:thiol:disulfide interchange protein [Terrihabitans soli]|uniref:Thiol:disulfide interchange protein n=1 Tax=Terrihabitans soli TaxID=708113 RepID=A0A6S6QJS1_9HYPH|nr:DsbE family thiol:disulfide interchange protein [Terrihabitans soli]BCJ89476.1 thiol:disulfide interchange protein [Terrihabitans soli]